MLREDVDAHRQPDAGLLPRLLLPQGFVDDPFAQRQRQIAALDRRQELPRQQQPELRMLPADQGLDADDGAGAHIHLGLIVQAQLVPPERLRKPPAHLVPLGLLAFVVRIEIGDAIPAAAFRLVHRLVGIPEQCVRLVGFIPGKNNDANTHACRHRQSAQLMGL